MELQQDFADLLQAFADARVRYLLVGGYAVGFHARPRFTKDIDLWLDAAEANIQRAAEALTAFGAPPDVVELLRNAGSDEIVYLGKPPFRVDLFRSIPGLDFDDAYARRIVETWSGVTVSVIGLEDLIASKRETDRPQDRLDLRALRKVRG
ncbi:MAG: nucleotidyltransferase [Myxococcota bacterium]